MVSSAVQPTTGSPHLARQHIQRYPRRRPCVSRETSSVGESSPRHPCPSFAGVNTQAAGSDSLRSGTSGRQWRVVTDPAEGPNQMAPSRREVLFHVKHPRPAESMELCLTSHTPPLPAEYPASGARHSTAAAMPRPATIGDGPVPRRPALKQRQANYARLSHYAAQIDRRRYQT